MATHETVQIAPKAKQTKVKKAQVEAPKTLTVQVSVKHGESALTIEQFTFDLSGKVTQSIKQMLQTFAKGTFKLFNVEVHIPEGNDQSRRTFALTEKILAAIFNGKETVEELTKDEELKKLFIGSLAKSYRFELYTFAATLRAVKIVKNNWRAKVRLNNISTDERNGGTIAQTEHIKNECEIRELSFFNVKNSYRKENNLPELPMPKRLQELQKRLS